MTCRKSGKTCVSFISGLGHTPMMSEQKSEIID